MKKELKDCLHLYLGCEMYVFPVSTVTDGWLKNYLSKYPNAQYKIILAADSLSRILKDGYLPILRPLSDMTEDEGKECGNMDYDFSDDIELNKWQFTDFELLISPNQFKYLLSKHFDLFGLIESGLAIDATTLKEGERSK